VTKSRAKLPSRDRDTRPDVRCSCDCAVDLAEQFDRTDASQCGAGDTHVGEFLANRGRRSGWPWVRDSIAARRTRARDRQARDDLFQRGQQHSVARAFQHQAVSQVVDVFRGAAKWMNSDTARFQRRSGAFLEEYSTALTSWLVVASIALTRSASATEKVSRCRRACRWRLRKRRTSAISARRPALQPFNSTMTRVLINAYSLKNSRNGAVLLHSGHQGGKAVSALSSIVWSDIEVG